MIAHKLVSHNGNESNHKGNYSNNSNDGGNSDYRSSSTNNNRLQEGDCRDPSDLGSSSQKVLEQSSESSCFS